MSQQEWTAYRRRRAEYLEAERRAQAEARDRLAGIRR